MIKQIQAASHRLANVAHRTPVLTSRFLNQMLGSEVFFKCENFQKVGAFKFRGAYNAISQLSETQKSNGVIAYSSGNHAQAVACVGKMLGVNTIIVMPNDAPRIKLAATRGYGAEVILYDPQTETREAVAESVLEGRSMTLIPPFNHEDVIAGQGTVAYELCQQVENLDSVMAPCGGGGLLSGTAVAAKHLNPNGKVYGTEPELANDAAISFKTGKIYSQPNPPTIADGTRTACVGDKTFALIQQHVDDILTVSEESIMQAVRFFFYRMKLVVEPSGALGLAALLSEAYKGKGRIGVIISGGNIDGETMSQILSDGDFSEFG